MLDPTRARASARPGVAPSGPAPSSPLDLRHAVGQLAEGRASGQGAALLQGPMGNAALTGALGAGAPGGGLDDLRDGTEALRSWLFGDVQDAGAPPEDPAPSNVLAHCDGKAETTGGGAVVGPDGEVGVDIDLLPPEIIDAHQDQVAVIEQALLDARRLVPPGLSALSQRGTSPEYDNRLEHLIGSSSEDHVRRFSAILRALGAGLAESVPIEIEGDDWKLSALEYVRDCEINGAVVGDLFTGGWRISNIHLTWRWFTKSPNERARILLHEASHKYTGTLDHAYFPESRRDSLTLDEHLDNADTYAWFCDEAREGITPLEERRSPEDEVAMIDRHFDTLHAMVLSGELQLYDHIENPWIFLPNGEKVCAYTFSRRMAKRFPLLHPEAMEALRGAIHLGEYDGEGPFTAPDGVTVPENIARTEWLRENA